jgi:hypothetical protein
MTDAEQVATYARSLSGFRIVVDPDVPYSHMGATITDAVLQSGLRYETQVRPKVQHVLTAVPEAVTTSAFLSALRERGGEEVVHWKDPERLGRMEAVAELFISEGVETESDLHAWLCGDGPQAQANAAKLDGVRGIGPKTIDYFKILCGEEDTAAIDLHLMRFIEEAGVHPRDYEEARDVIVEAAGLFGVSAARFDHSIWAYMSKGAGTG